MADELSHTISIIVIGNAQRKMEETTIDQTELIKTHAFFELDQSVIDGI
jgi:hypothetical protein